MRSPRCQPHPTALLFLGFIAILSLCTRFSYFPTFDTCTCRSRIGHGPCPCERSLNVRSIINLGGVGGLGHEGWGGVEGGKGHEGPKKSEKVGKSRKVEKSGEKSGYQP